MFGPNVTFATAGHPVEPLLRSRQCCGLWKSLQSGKGNRGKRQKILLQRQGNRSGLKKRQPGKYLKRGGTEIIKIQSRQIFAP